MRGVARAICAMATAVVALNFSAGGASTRPHPPDAPAVGISWAWAVDDSGEEKRTQLHIFLVGLVAGAVYELQMRTAPPGWDPYGVAPFHTSTLSVGEDDVGSVHTRAVLPAGMGSGKHWVSATILDTFPGLGMDDALVSRRSSLEELAGAPQAPAEESADERERSLKQGREQHFAIEHRLGDSDGQQDAEGGSDGQTCVHAHFRLILGTWLSQAGWKVASACTELHCMAVDRAEKHHLGGRSSEVWIDSEAGLVLKRIVSWKETFEREIFWLRYWEEQGEDIAPRLLASFPGSHHESPILLMTHVGEILVPENAPPDWERQV